MARVYVSVGSNIDRARNVRACLAALRERFGELIVSTIYETGAVGFDGDDFYNLVVGFDTGQDVHAVARILRAIEDRQKRERGAGRFTPRTLDLDLLLYDDLVLHGDGLQLPRGEVTRYAFVLRPLAEVAGDRVHPTRGRTIGELWQAFDASGERLEPVAPDIERAIKETP
ncbi:MAG: 2-amino-4-hydroxy-6-hydroxymethyldihydropteridine diphosphokinase [Gammaproteobacteria bacterium]|nr:2-amino-4-hydroxy-6-hydroxymethyldihydropteridine diphosphokinase [Gammaproteobacteria bacterium]NIR98623.1 2-amino-4-hydroxy-6-hydroxymethyldihydropteridine diphosphokinase [Gammaproteobacteria bacterium]NIT64346.1 2-amino-4-hydroxy-6-hydroxymethyldihydropteridine diphosphokinase [Gammaproteobacteria bacterium]NIV21270.1 2-amino-4-hydroxy-6-hydroxymethyldihydropteridine diphosphokinase [Gammaproteobacteria bacterium]NIX10974.1 2-amino-4-hydroxy-6-hydroxymethyldihydropteridine diphosphokinas